MNSLPIPAPRTVSSKDAGNRRPPVRHRFFLGFSPEREDQANRQFQTSTITKVFAGDYDHSWSVVTSFHGAVVKTAVPVSTTATAEAIKWAKNVFARLKITGDNIVKT